MKGVIVSSIVVVALVQFMAMPGEAIDCDKVSSNLAPCIPYLTGPDAASSAGCCAGVKNLKTLAPTTEDRRVACDCIKEAAAHYPDIKYEAASSLPKNCGVEFHIPIPKPPTARPATKIKSWYSGKN